MNKISFNLKNPSLTDKSDRLTITLPQGMAGSVSKLSFIKPDDVSHSHVQA